MMGDDYMSTEKITKQKFSSFVKIKTRNKKNFKQRNKGYD